MSIQLNHTIVASRDAKAAAAWLAELLGLPAPTTLYHFECVETANGVTLDHLTCDAPFEIQHYAFLVTEAEFDAIFARIVARALPYWADPFASRPQELNHNDGGRGVYFRSPDGHYLELLTRPYGSGAAGA
ncbi:MAG: VOC family protein [Polyangiales bacterium]